ncbi:MAG: PCRF domain-containing protein, partial [bacterium]
MNPATEEKLRRLAERREEIQALLSDPEVIAAQARFRELSIELAEIEPLADAFAHHRRLARQLSELRAMLDDGDDGIRDLAKEEMPAALREIDASESALQRLLLPKDAN